MADILVSVQFWFLEVSNMTKHLRVHDNVAFDFGVDVLAIVSIINIEEVTRL